MPCKQEEEEVQGQWLQLGPVLCDGKVIMMGFLSKSIASNWMDKVWQFLEDNHKENYRLKKNLSESLSELVS